MKHLRWKFGLLILAAGYACLAPEGIAQDPQSGEPPKPAARTYGPVGAENSPEQNQDPGAVQPDDRPLTGIQQTTIGAPMERHSYWVPGVSYYNVIQSNGTSQGGSSNWSTTNYLMGNISLLENWSRSQLAVNYSGGGSLSSDSAVGNSMFHQFSAVQTFHWERWKMTLLDQFAYLPQSQFGFGAGTGLALPGIGGTLGPSLPGLQNGLSPAQSIFTAIGPRFVNTFGTQIDYTLTARSSVTLGGVYSILRFEDPGNIESNELALNAGYNYQITSRDTLGLVYRFSSYHYLGSPQAIGDQAIQAAYGKKITGRLALQLGAGPEISNYRIPQGTSNKTHYIGVSANANLTYAFSRWGTSLSYLHGTTSGSGVFLGATTDQVTGSLSRKFTPLWSGEAHFGFAHNANVQTAVGATNQDYNTVFAGVSLARPLGRNAGFGLAYTAYRESANSAVCASNCGSSFTTHQITVGVNWHTRPFVLQ